MCLKCTWQGMSRGKFRRFPFPFVTLPHWYASQCPHLHSHSVLTGYKVIERSPYPMIPFLTCKYSPARCGPGESIPLPSPLCGQARELRRMGVGVLPAGLRRTGQSGCARTDITSCHLTARRSRHRPRRGRQRRPGGCTRKLGSAAGEDRTGRWRSLVCSKRCGVDWRVG